MTNDRQRTTVLKMKPFFLALSTFLHAGLGLTAWGLFLHDFGEKPFSVQRGMGSVEVEIVSVGREGVEKNIEKKVTADSNKVDSAVISTPIEIGGEILPFNSRKRIPRCDVPRDDTNRSSSQPAATSSLNIPSSQTLGVPDTDSGISGNPVPPYPRMALLKGWEGEVLLKVAVNEEGQVSSVSVSQSSGREILDASALHTIQEWKFSRGLSRVLEVPVKFVLRGGGSYEASSGILTLNKSSHS
ncbi:MAG: energy transducer TonB [Chlamydiae bacterium]|nr:energy transducer TonB [Chlamydiota bacterium]MBI3266258.1 energy transducer TonB [Chlamydiota bacterium]